VARGSSVGFSSAFWTVSSSFSSAGLVTGTLAFSGNGLSSKVSRGFSDPFIGLKTLDLVSKAFFDSAGFGWAVLVSGLAMGTAASLISGAGSPGAGASVISVSLTEGGAGVWLLALPVSVN